MSRGIVALYAVPGRDFTSRHERATQAEIARRLAALKGFDFVGEDLPKGDHRGPVYLVPNDTLAGLGAAAALGLRGEHDLFGGVVPHAFMAAKAIAHPLVAPNATAPHGWSAEFGRKVAHVVLSGLSAFTPDDARQAGARLLKRGPVRLKRVRATGGRGQVVVSDEAALDTALGMMDPKELGEHGLVLEEDLTGVTTYSIGQVRVAEFVATYWGTQQLTSDNGGAVVYGGSSLHVARGGFQALLALPLTEEVRLAVTQARAFDAAASECFAGMFASRRNYDVASGRDAAGHARCGVLEQSWRMGGASGAEIAALQAFQAEPRLRVVHARSVEVYGASEAPPPGATIYFRGVDERVGFITKYTTVELHGDA